MADEHPHEHEHPVLEEVADVVTWRPHLPRLLRLLAVLVIVYVAVRWSGLWDLVRDEERLSQTVDDAGLFGPVLFVAFFTLLVPIGVPGLVFVLPASVIFSDPTAIALSLLGGYTSSSIGVIAARTVGRETIAQRLPPKFLAWDERIAARGLIAVIGLRVITYLAAPADWLLGLSSIRMRTIILGTVIGLFPPTVMYVVAGGGIFDLLS